MRKIFLVLKREYLSRVRKRSFLVMTILGPLIFAAFIILPMWLSSIEDKGIKTIAVIEGADTRNTVPDSLKVFSILPNKENLKFDYVNISLEDIKKTFEYTKYYGILYIPHNVLYTQQIYFYSDNDLSSAIDEYITNAIEKYIHNIKLRKNNISLDIINSVETNIELKTIKIAKGTIEGEQVRNTKRALGYAGGFLIYFFIFFFGTQVIRGVIEEKTNRIVELIISSVKPFQLMMGKVIGIGLVGLTQFIAWAVLTLSIATFAQQTFFNPGGLPSTSELSSEDFFKAQTIQQTENNQVREEVNGFMDNISTQYILFLILTFLFYFIGGYLLYGSMYAALGSAVDSETDTQQFMLPITLPLLLSIFIMINTFNDPGGKLAVIFSIIPFTSPIVMMARMPFQPPISEIALSMIVLILTFILIIWMAGKIYRTGILMYGKKASYRELWKWLKYKG